MPVTLIHDNDRLYELTKTNDSYSLLVVCGGIAWREVVICLNAEEVERYKTVGKPFVDEMAYDIAKNDPKYEGRIRGV